MISTLIIRTKSVGTHSEIALDGWRKINGLVVSDNKQLAEPMLTQTNVAKWRH